jgi:hypothetical protein
VVVGLQEIVDLNNAMNIITNENREEVSLWLDIFQNTLNL